MKKLIIGTFLIIFAQCGCSYTYYGLTDDPDEIWIASEPELYLRYSESERIIQGATRVKGETIYVVIYITKNGAVDFYSYNDYLTNEFYLDSPLASGAIGKDINGRADVEIYEEKNSLFPDCKKFKLTKYNISEVEWVDGWPVPIEG